MPAVSPDMEDMDGRDDAGNEDRYAHRFRNGGPPAMDSEAANDTEGCFGNDELGRQRDRQVARGDIPRPHASNRGQDGQRRSPRIDRRRHTPAEPQLGNSNNPIARPIGSNATICAPHPTRVSAVHKREGMADLAASAASFAMANQTHDATAMEARGIPIQSERADRSPCAVRAVLLARRRPRATSARGKARCRHGTARCVRFPVIARTTGTTPRKAGAITGPQ